MSRPADDTTPIKVAIVDDHPLIRDGTAAILALEPDMVVVAMGENLADARAILAADDVDVMLLDIRLGTDSGLTALHGRTGQRPAVVVVTAYAFPQYAEAAFRLGASGLVVKDAPSSELVSAVRAAAAGGLHFGLRPAQRLPLSDRELEVVRRVAQGRSNDEIGIDLNISSKTVESHLSRIFERVGVASRTELATRAISEGWLDLPI